MTSLVPSTGTPASLSPDEGELHFCGGTWAARISTMGSVDIYGHDTAVIDGRQQGPVLYMMQGASVNVSGLTLTNGSVTVGNGGAGVLCSRTDSPTLTLTDVVVSNNHALSYGGGVYIDGCTLTAERLTVSRGRLSCAGELGECHGEP